MKDYEKQVIWLDYFNSSYSRSQGRRISRNRSIKNPILSDLLEAAKRLNLNPVSHEVIHPKRTLINSCLLYTSPSPRDRTRSRMPSSA